MIKTVVFNQDIDRSYLSNLKNSKRFIRKTRSQSFSRAIVMLDDDKPDLIRKREYCSDEDQNINYSEINTPVSEVDTVTDIDGLRQLAENRQKHKSMQKDDDTQINEKNNNKSTHRFLPAPPKNPVPPGARRRSIPVRSKKLKITNDF